MSHTLLLEIGLEEMPARVVQTSSQQLVDRMANFLKEARLDFESIKPYATPRRLTVQVLGLAEKQADLSEHLKGPAEAIAKDEDGNWTKAAEGFAKGQGLSSDDIYFEDVSGKSYAFVDKKTAGKATMEAVKDIKTVITAMTFPVTMRWGKNSFEYVRPIHWIAAMLDKDVIPFTLLDVTSGREVAGHRFLGQTVTLQDAKDYETDLEKEYVIADRNKRQALITEQIQALAEKEGFKVADNSDLLDEVTDLVEYPTAFVGNFSEKFLDLPVEVLVTSMQDNQRYFAVYDTEGNILPKFVSVRNGNRDYLENVIAGNEKVLVARLSDALFFYEEDQKKGITFFNDKLDKVVFHDGLGTMAEKVNRLRQLVKLIGKQVGLSSEELVAVDRAAELSKFDLTTGMVDEFSELQGNMGGIYARLAGESEAVSQAIYEQYQPTSSEGELPSSAVASVLALADKLDNLMSFFAAGIIPTGSNDPNALRRQAYGVLRIIKANGWRLDMLQLIDKVADEITFPARDFVAGISENKEALRSFFKNRIRQYLERQHIVHDIIEASLRSNQHNFVDIIENAQVLAKNKQNDAYKDFVEQTSRVLNLFEKAEEAVDDGESLDKRALTSDSEKALAAAIDNFDQDVVAEEYYAELVDLSDKIADFFEHNMVMSDNETERANRLALIYKLGKIILNFSRSNDLVI